MERNDEEEERKKWRRKKKEKIEEKVEWRGESVSHGCACSPSLDARIYSGLSERPIKFTLAKNEGQSTLPFQHICILCPNQGTIIMIIYEK